MCVNSREANISSQMVKFPVRSIAVVVVVVVVVITGIIIIIIIIIRRSFSDMRDESYHCCIQQYLVIRPRVDIF